MKKLTKLVLVAILFGSSIASADGDACIRLVDQYLAKKSALTLALEKGNKSAEAVDAINSTILDLNVQFSQDYALLNCTN